VAILTGVLGLAGCGGALDTASVDGDAAVDASVSEAGEEERADAAGDQAIIDDVLDKFCILAAVPRQSGHEKEISDTLRQWAEDLGLSGASERCL
jgi:hypothetical protein